MTPKEKADELYEAFFYSIPPFTDEGQLEHKTAKQCALIAVNEVISYCHAEHIQYWQEVKQEIQNL